MKEKAIRRAPYLRAMLKRFRKKLLAAGYQERSISDLPKHDFQPEILDKPLTDDFHQARESLSVPASYFRSDQYKRRMARADWRSVDPRVATFAGLFIKAARKRGIPLYVHTALRDPYEQKRLKSQGFSKLAVGPHCFGGAVDIVHCRRHWDMTETEWLYLSRIGFDVLRNYKLLKEFQWGGDWDMDTVPVPDDPDEQFWDPAHWQLRTWRSLPSVLWDGDVSPIRYGPQKLARALKDYELDAWHPFNRLDPRERLK